MALVLSVREGYDRWAELYDGDGNPLCLLEEPHVDRLLGDVRNLAVGDIGCGTGRHALRLAAHGARVTAVDFSAGMLAKARAKPGAEQVTWVEHDIASELPFSAATFDRVVCALVVDHIRDLRAFFAELRRITKPGGAVVVSVMHPAMMLKGTQARFHDPATGQEVRPESVAHQVSDYVMGAVRAGLVIDEMSEHFVEPELVKQASRAEKYLGWPMLLLFRFAC
jgi:ubiquinone/menaquinone biosynthesis C-methylase UbiE